MLGVPPASSGWWEQGTSAAVPKYTRLDIYGTCNSTSNTPTYSPSTSSAPAEDVFCYLCRAGWWPDGSIMAQVRIECQSITPVYHDINTLYIYIIALRILTCTICTFYCLHIWQVQNRSQKVLQVHFDTILYEWIQSIYMY